jgi:hypothetical protein
MRVGMADQTLSEALEAARARLESPKRRREPVWPALTAAGFFAASALMFAAAAILVPPVRSDPPAAAATLRGAN